MSKYRVQKGGQIVRVFDRIALGQWMKNHMVKRGRTRYDGSNNSGIYIMRDGKTAFWNKETGELALSSIPGGRELHLIAKALDKNLHSGEKEVKSYEELWNLPKMQEYIPAFVGVAEMEDNTIALITEQWNSDFFDYYHELLDKKNPIWIELVANIETRLNKEWATLEELQVNPSVIKLNDVYIENRVGIIVRNIMEKKDVSLICNYLPKERKSKFMTMLNKQYKLAPTDSEDIQELADLFSYQKNKDALNAWLFGDLKEAFDSLEKVYYFDDVLESFRSGLDEKEYFRLTQDANTFLELIVQNYESLEAIKNKWWMKSDAAPILLRHSRKYPELQPRMTLIVKNMIREALNKPISAPFFKGIVAKLNNSIMRLYGTLLQIHHATNRCQRDVTIPGNTNFMVRSTIRSDPVTFEIFPRLSIPRDNVELGMVDFGQVYDARETCSLLQSLEVELSLHSPENVVYKIVSSKLSNFPLVKVIKHSSPHVTVEDVVKLYKENTDMANSSGGAKTRCISWNKRKYKVRRNANGLFIKSKGADVQLRSIKGRYSTIKI